MTEEEYYQQMWNESRHGCGGLMTALFIIVALLAMLTGCRTQYVSVPEYHTEYIVKHDSVTLRDSIWQHDSVYVERSGDTLLVEKWRTKYQLVYRDVVRIDSFVKTDSVQVPYPVERKFSFKERMYITIGKIIIWPTLIVIVALIIYLALKFRRH